MSTQIVAAQLAGMIGELRAAAEGEQGLERRLEIVASRQGDVVALGV